MAKNLKILFATFSPWHKNQRLPTNGMVEPMLSFFVPKVNRVVLIDQPHPGSDKLIPQIEVYEKGKLFKKTASSFLLYFLYPLLMLNNSVGTQIPFKIRDFLSVIDFVLYDRKKFDIFIGLESINTLAGVILKKLGLVKTVVYYVSDYSPQRYKNLIFNKLYLFLDQLAAYKADYIWDVSKAIMPARISVGLKTSLAAPCINVPNALFPTQIDYLPQSEIIPNSLVFAGTLGQENGPDLAIESLQFIRLEIPNVTLHIFGGGETDVVRLQNLTKTLHLEHNVIFHGFVYDQVELSRKIKSYAIGLAPYKAIHGSPRWWADATKIRLYLAAGLPVITTQVPPLGKELLESKSGFVANDNPKEYSASILRLLKENTIYTKMRTNAIQQAKNNTWENTYRHALSKMGIDI